MIDANGVCAQVGHLFGIELALVFVKQGVVRRKLVGDTCSVCVSLWQRFVLKGEAVGYS